MEIGKQVKLARIPPPVLEERLHFPETFELFRRAIGGTFTVRGVDEHGHVELWLQDDGREDLVGAANSIWVEPEHLVLA